MRKLSTFFRSHPKEVSVCAVLLLLIICGAVSFAAGRRSAQKDTVSVVLQKEEMPEQTGPATPSFLFKPYATASQAEYADAAIAQPDQLSLAYVYPDGADTSQVSESLAGLLYRELAERDARWISGIYDLYNYTPEQAAAFLGPEIHGFQGGASVPQEFKEASIQFYDGSGPASQGYSNARSITAMCSVLYDYGILREQEELERYSRLLWDASHSYTLGISDVYYCDGCLDKTEEELAMEAEAEEEAAAAMLSPKEQLISEKDSSNLPSKETLSLNETLQETQSPEESLPAETASEAARPEIAKGSEEAPLVIHHENSSEPWETPSGQTALEEAQEASPSVMASSYDAASPLSLSEEPGQLLDEPLSAEEEDSACPGHVDLQIQVRILGINDKHGLFSIDQTGNTPDLENGWEGWTEENQNFANSIAQQDWFADYGLSVSSLSLSDPLSHEEIEEYMAALPANLSETRREIIRFALNSVGKVPYYWGGKASYPNYEGNRFGSLVPADDQGRILKGLDCSGWISWVYWSVTGTKLEAQSTSSLILCGQEISRSELQPGDIVVRTGANAHVVMFLGWSADGKMNVIHESSASVNNVTLKTMEAAWPYYRKLVD